MTKNSLNNYGLKLLACQLLFKTMTNAVRSKADSDILSSNTTYLLKTFNSLCDLIKFLFYATICKCEDYGTNRKQVKT